MAISLFSSKSVNLLKDEMCICLDDLQNHLISTAPTKLEFFGEFFDFLADLNLPHEHVELGSDEYHENNQFLKREMSGFYKSVDVNDNTEEYLTIDNICHSFLSFKNHGLLHLYKNREAESWYPKVVIRRNLGTNNLVGDVVIYRGTSKYELESGKFSQSWTLSKEIAHDFAFKHYSDQDAYVNTERVVVKAKISALNIYCYDETDNEHEVIIDERMVVGATIIFEGILD